MNEHFDRHQSRMTDRERAAVWNRIREGHARTSSWKNWKLWSPVATGALATVVLAFVLIDKTPDLAPTAPEHPERSSATRQFSTDVDPRAESTPADRARDGDEPAASPAQRDVAESSPAPEEAAGSREADRPARPDAEGSTQGKAPAPAPSASAAQESSAEVDGPDRESRKSTGYLEEKRRDADSPASVDLQSKSSTGADQASADSGGPTRSEVMSEALAPAPAAQSRTDSPHDIESKDLERHPVNEIEEAVGLEAGAIARGGELHFRGGRSGEINVTVDGVPQSTQSREESSAALSDEAGAKMRSFGYIGSDGTATSSVPPSATDVLGYSTGGDSTPNDKPHDAMFFQHYGANPLVLADMDSFSTFATDVDQGAYTIMRRYVEGGHLPDRDSPRVEEFVNYFDGGYPEFYNPDFRILVDGAPSPFGDGFYLVRVGVKGRVIDASERKPANLVFVVDVSGSMAVENRLGLVRQSLRVLLDQLRPDDRVGIVAYGSTAFVVLESTTVEDRRIIEEAIESLQTNGATNAEDGLLLGYEMAQRHFDPEANNRILLCSDGVANVGRTGPDSILERVASEADKGIDLTTIGFGMGNYNDVLMERLADQGDGVYYYVDDLEEARRVFVENLSGTLQTIARDAKIQVAFDPSVVLAYRLLGFENRDVADKDFRNDAVDAGEIGAGHEVTALYEVRFQKGVEVGAKKRFATAYMRYEIPDAKVPRPSGVSMERSMGDRSAGRESSGWDAPLVQEIEQALTLDRIERSIDRTSPRFRLAAVVAEYAEILRQSYWAKGQTIAGILPMAREVARELQDDPDVTEFLRLVEKAQHLEETMSPEERAARDRFAEGQTPAPPYFPPVLR